MDFDYIASGPGHTRFSLNEFRNDEKAKECVTEMLSRVQGKNSHHFSFLYNGFQEAKYGEIFQETGIRDSVYSIHSDSGGLQIVTQGKTATPEIKKQIYEAQGLNSDYAMSFDEIPVYLPFGQSDRNDVTNRFFDRDNLEKYARQSGRNLRDQLAYFVERDFKSKPLLIVQGNSKDTFQRWVDYVLDEIPKELQDKIGGFASGSAALGNGQLEDIERAFYSTQLELPENIKSYMHVLGVGSLKRMLPIVTFKRTGLTGNTRISYDSSTHASGLSMGHYYEQGRGIISLSRNKNKEFFLTVNDIMKNWGDMIDFDLEHILMLSVLGKADDWNNFAASNQDKIYQRYIAVFGFFLSSVTNFTSDIENVFKTGDYMPYFKRPKEGQGYAYLEKIRTLDDFEHWKKEVGKYLRSNRVRELSMMDANLEDFFV